MNTKNIEIQRHSKNIYSINGERFDVVRDWKCKDGRWTKWNFSPVRKALTMYYCNRNANLKGIFVDSLVCDLINNNLAFIQALEYQTVFARI